MCRLNLSSDANINTFMCNALSPAEVLQGLWWAEPRSVIDRSIISQKGRKNRCDEFLFFTFNLEKTTLRKIFIIAEYFYILFKPVWR